jgi:hypothetical protein
LKIKASRVATNKWQQWNTLLEPLKIKASGVAIVATLPDYSRFFFNEFDSIEKKSGNLFFPWQQWQQWNKPELTRLIKKKKKKIKMETMETMETKGIRTKGPKTSFAYLV